MSEPTLEQIAETPSPYDSPPYPTQLDAVLARELLALRKETGDGRIGTLQRQVARLNNDMRALERSHPANGDLPKYVGLLRERAERAERERDDLKDALDELCGPDVESRHDAREYLIHSVSSVVKRARKERDAALANADRMREALKRITTYVDFGTQAALVKDLREMAQAALDSASTETKDSP